MVLIQEKFKSNPLKQGIFCAFILGFLIFGTMIAMPGCGTGNQPEPNEKVASKESEDTFVLMGYRDNVLQKSFELINASEDFISSEMNISTNIKINGVAEQIQIDAQNAYPCAYPDNRMLVFYPCANIKLPEDDETIPIGLIHYFDDLQMNVFFYVIASMSTGDEMITESSDALPSSEYKLVFQSGDGSQYGIAGSRILNKSDLADEEAFRKFDTSSRTVLVGTNSLDENKFLFVFLKIPDWDDRIFQIFYRWF
ncbi:hypothetical protein J7L05_05680 [bacterium]|nr:hypothetical protein [bacterium]